MQGGNANCHAVSQNFPNRKQKEKVNERNTNKCDFIKLNKTFIIQNTHVIKCKGKTKIWRKYFNRYIR